LPVVYLIHKDRVAMKEDANYDRHLAADFIALIGWAITCGLIMNVWSRVDPASLTIAGRYWP
jgi:hypothetical protein